MPEFLKVATNYKKVILEQHEFTLKMLVRF